jgi:hypothetical protein
LPGQPTTVGRRTAPAAVHAYAAGMNDRINQILNEMAVLEDELRTAVHDQESRMFFKINGSASSSSAP